VGLTAENVAERYGITREAQDAFSARSHQRAAAAAQAGKLKHQIVPVSVKVQRALENGRFEFTETIFDRDEGIRADTTVESLAKLSPAFKIGGTVTAGNSSQMSDGAAAVLLMTREKAKELKLEPLAVFRHYAVEGCEAEYMGIGPVVAVPKVLGMAGLKLGDIGLIEINEAFAAQAVHCIRTLGLNEDITNVNGGAIAYGHPLGCTGSMYTNMLVYEMHRRKARFGILTMCIGFGMGAAAIYEVEEHRNESELAATTRNGEEK
jgi:acetyl-CoA acyltransferase